MNITANYALVVLYFLEKERDCDVSVSVFFMDLSLSAKLVTYDWMLS